MSSNRHARPSPALTWLGLVLALGAGLVIGIGGLQLLTVLAHPLALLILAISLVPTELRGELRRILEGIGQAIGGYIWTSVINALVVGSLSAIGLKLIGVDFPLGLGVFAGLLEFIPIVGPMISDVKVVIAALLQLPTLAIAALVYMFLLQQSEGHLLVPKVMHSKTDFSPLLLIFALLAGDTVGGELGALVAIPIASAMQVLFLEMLVPEIRHRMEVEDLNQEGV